MKIQIDTINKTIKVEESVNLGELITELKRMLPDWRDYKIDPSVTWNTFPVYPIYPTYPTYPTWEQPPIVTVGRLTTTL